jgi:uncharacterized membrane protein YdjX (TVP38/TMEM64 family)
MAADHYPVCLCKVSEYVYTCCSWLGMLPGTWAYVSAGATRRAFIVGASLCKNSLVNVLCVSTKMCKEQKCRLIF